MKSSPSLKPQANLKSKDDFFIAELIAIPNVKETRRREGSKPLQTKSEKLSQSGHFSEEFVIDEPELEMRRKILPLKENKTKIQPDPPTQITPRNLKQSAEFRWKIVADEPQGNAMEM